MKEFRRNFSRAFLLIAIIWIVHFVNIFLQMSLNRYGILPRSLEGLRGILFAPFLHGDLLHLVSNTLPLFFLSLALFHFFRRSALPVIILAILLGGLLVWLFGRTAMHVGASGLIYSLAGFLMAIGIFRRNFQTILISTLIFLLYGGIIWGVFPTEPWVSWEAHLFGFLVGILLAWIFRKEKESTQGMKAG